MKIRSKNGFTLIELLAVVIILGLLIMIAVPAISENVNTATKKTYKQHEKSMEEAAINMMNGCIDKNGVKCNLPNKGEKSKIYLSELIDKNYIEELKDPEGNNDVILCEKDKSYITVENKSNKNDSYDLEYSVCLKCSNYESGYCSKKEEEMDCSKAGFPTCGENLYENTLWTNKDVTIGTKCIASSGTKCTQEVFYKTFNETTPSGKGQITITNTCGKSTTCNANVYIDKAKPTCELKVTNGTLNNGWYRGEVEVSLNNMTDGQSGIATYGIGTSSSPTYNKQKTIKLEEGISNVYGYVKDRAGNENKCVLEVQKDSEKPTIEDIHYGYEVYPKKDTTESKTGTIINIKNLDYYTGICGVKIKFNKTVNTTTKVKKGTTELSKITINSNEIIHWLPSCDNQTNLGIDVGNTDAINNVSKIEVITKDTTGFYTNKDVTIYVDASDSISTVTDYSFDDGKSYQKINEKTYPDNKEVIIKVKDKSGNESDPKTVIINNIDKANPSGELELTGTEGKNSWYTSNVTLKIVNLKDNQSPLASGASGIKTYYIEGINAPTHTHKNDTSSVSYKAVIIDKAGNETKVEKTFKKDATNPIVSITKDGTLGNNDWYKEKDVNLTLSYKDDTSGILSYGLNPEIPKRNGITKTIQSDTTGVTWYGSVEDNAGNIATISESFKVDTKAPTKVTINNPKDGVWTNQNIPVTQTCTETTSGVAYWTWQYKDQHQTGVNKNENSATSTFNTIYSAERNEKSYITVCDNAGNCSGEVTTKIQIDKTKPLAPDFKWIMPKDHNGVERPGRLVSDSCSSQITNRKADFNCTINLSNSSYFENGFVYDESGGSPAYTEHIWTHSGGKGTEDYCPNWFQSDKMVVGKNCAGDGGGKWSGNWKASSPGGVNGCWSFVNWKVRSRDVAGNVGPITYIRINAKAC